MRPVDGEADAGAAAFQLVRQLADLVLGLRQRHAVAGDDDDVLGLRKDGRRGGRFFHRGGGFGGRGSRRGVQLAVQGLHTGFQVGDHRLQFLDFLL